MGDMEEHPLLTRFPEDADWEQFDNLSLRRQCLIRDIPNDQTTRDYKLRVLKEYQKTHVTEVRKISWRREPGFLSWEEKLSRLGSSDHYYIVQVKDRSTSHGTNFSKEFTFCDAEGWTCIVAFQEIPTCTCQSQTTYNCVHVIYLLRFVLSCPEHLLWQAAFLPSEVEVIYQYSRALPALLSTDDKARDVVCVICFKSNTQKQVTCCSTCGRAVHQDCLKFVMEVRKPKPPGSCWMCEDSSEWDIEKYLSDNPETNERPSDATIISEKDGVSEDGSVYVENKPKDKLNGEDDAEGDLEQEQDEDNDMPENELDNEGNVGKKLEKIEIFYRMDSPPPSSLSLSSSSGFPPHSQFAVDKRGLFTLPNAQHPSHASKDVLPRRVNLTPLPTIPFQRSASVPITSNLEPMLLELKQQGEQEKSEKHPRGVSLDCNSALANSRTPVPSVGFTSLKPPVTPVGAFGQDAQTPPPLAVNIESQDAVSATAAVTAQTAISNPPEGSPNVALVDGYPPVSTAGDVPKRKAANLIRKFRRLEKETSYIGKRAKRSIKNIHREYEHELKVLKRKRKKLEKKLRACN